MINSKKNVDNLVIADLKNLNELKDNISLFPENTVCLIDKEVKTNSYKDTGYRVSDDGFITQWGKSTYFNHQDWGNSGLPFTGPIRKLKNRGNWGLYEMDFPIAFPHKVLKVIPFISVDQFEDDHGMTIATIDGLTTNTYAAFSALENWGHVEKMAISYVAIGY